MEIGIDSFVASVADSGLRVAPEVRMRDLLDEIALADEVGLDSLTRIASDKGRPPL